jgi:hypothetical protein
VGSMECLGVAWRPQHARRQVTWQGARGAQLAWLLRPGRVSLIEAILRTDGGQRSGRRGSQFWAISGLILDMGQEAKLEPTRCSTNLIKEEWSLGFYISG